jgi:lipoprotein-releasing system permease protein
LPYRAIEVRLKNIGELPLSKRYLQNIFGDRFYIRDVFEINSNLFSIVKLVQLILFILLGLTAAIALLQLHSQIQLLIYEKHQSLSILKSLGFRFSQWILLFFWIATYLAVICLGSGLILGLLFARGLNPFILVLEKIFNIYLISNQIGALSYIGIAYPVSKIAGLLLLFYLIILGAVFLTIKSVFKYSSEGLRQ